MHTAPDATASQQPEPRDLGDFTATSCMLILAALAAVIGAVGAVLAWILLRLIEFFTNLFYYQRLSFRRGVASAQFARLAGGVHSDHRWPHPRIDGALRLGTYSRARHPRGNRSHHD